jgi:hypothetical protein
VGDKLFGSTLGANLLISLANHESLSLGKIVGGKHLLVKVVANGVVGLGSEDEVGRNQLSTLVNKLEEGVLSVGARLAEKDGT